MRSTNDRRKRRRKATLGALAWDLSDKSSRYGTRLAGTATMVMYEGCSCRGVAVDTSVYSILRGSDLAKLYRAAVKAAADAFIDLPQIVDVGHLACAIKSNRYQ